MNERVESGSKACRLPFPVAERGNRGDHQEVAGNEIVIAGCLGGSAGGHVVRVEFEQVEHERERLDCLAEPHVVGETAGETEAGERGEPHEALSLVRTEFPGEARWRARSTRHPAGNDRGRDLTHRLEVRRHLVYQFDELGERSEICFRQVTVGKTVYEFE